MLLFVQPDRSTTPF